jgi:GPH family glycoside/pentoside/hexuronide:cation symporter
MPDTPAPATQEPAPERLKMREKFSYGFGDLASVLYWQTISMFLAYFYTDVFGIAAASAGTLILLSRSTDAFFDPLMGMIADRTQTRWGKFRPYLLWCCVPMAVMGVLTFTVPDLATPGKLIWAYITFNALMLVYTAINIPYTAMLGVISPNPNERTTLSSIKFVGAFSANIIISGTMLPMVKMLGGQNAARGWQLSFVAIGVASIVFFLIVFLNTRERVVPPKAQKTSMARDLGDLFTNVPWIILLFTTITFILFVSLRLIVTVYYFKYYVSDQTITLPSFLPKIGGTQVWHMEGLVSWFGTTGQFAALAGVMLVPFFARITGRKIAFICLFIVAIACTAGTYLFRPDQLLQIFGLNILGSVTGGPLSALLWAMYADTADYAEWKRGRRATGLVFSASIFSTKQGWSLGSWIALVLMSSVGFVANAVQTQQSLNGLVKLMSVYPAAIGVLSLLILTIFYPLNEKRMSAIAAELKQRRAAEAVA